MSKSSKSPGSGEHPAVRAMKETLASVASTVDDALEESKRRLDEELEAYIDSIDQRDARHAFPSSY